MLLICNWSVRMLTYKLIIQVVVTNRDCEVEKMRLVLAILLLLIILFLAALLVTAYVITPIISWLVMNPLGGIVLLVITVILAAVLVREEMKEDKTD